MINDFHGAGRLKNIRTFFRVKMFEKFNEFVKKGSRKKC
jgi:hypothetical protein